MAETSLQMDSNAPVSGKKETLDPAWVNSIKLRHRHEPRTFKASSTRDSCSIHRVPQRFRRVGETDCVPQIISIGPFHYNKREGDLRAMEEHKWRYLHDILSRKGEDCLEPYLEAVKKMEESARECYSEEIELNSNAFVEMMFLDGCFIVELFRRLTAIGEYKDDPILNLGWLSDTLFCDLIMLENQIPFFIPQCLFDLMNISGPSLQERALVIFMSKYSSNVLHLDGGEWDQFSFQLHHSNFQAQHLLHLVHSYVTLLDNPKTSKLEMIPSASELEEAGIKFEKKEDTKGFLDIDFHKGVIRIPSLMILYATKCVYLNLIAFEHCYLHCKDYFTAYIIFMDLLMNSAKDVRILRQSNIIDNWLGSDDEVATLFNMLATEANIYRDEFYLYQVAKDINKYNRKAWPKLRATLMRDYFKNAWAILAFLAALVILVLTMSQAFFAAFPNFAYTAGNKHNKHGNNH